MLQVHTRYRQRGGEEAVVEAERELLSSRGVEIAQLVFDNERLHEGHSVAGDLRLAASTVWSESARRRVRAAVQRFRPDVIHVHNTFAAASPAVFWAGGKARPPVVQTLHNYRLGCPSATVFRDGHACADCFGRFVAWPGVVHACVRGSRRQSAAVASMLAMHRAVGTYARRVDAHIALTEFQRSQLVRAGIPARRIHVIPNFLDAAPNETFTKRRGFLYAGRLATEKGISTLLEAGFEVPGVVRIAGSGPLEESVAQAAAAGAVIALGQVPGSEVREQAARSIALVVPSLWYEGFPLVVLDAFASGTPVICSRIGSLAEIVEDGVSGLHVKPGDADGLAAAIRWAIHHADEMELMGQRAKRRFEERYSADRHLSALLQLYGSLLRSGARRSG